MIYFSVLSWHCDRGISKSVLPSKNQLILDWVNVLVILSQFVLAVAVGFLEGGNWHLFCTGRIWQHDWQKSIHQVAWLVWSQQLIMNRQWIHLGMPYHVFLWVWGSEKLTHHHQLYNSDLLHINVMGVSWLPFLSEWLSRQLGSCDIVGSEWSLVECHFFEGVNTMVDATSPVSKGYQGHIAICRYMVV